MLCKICGAQLSDTAQFCTNCGNRVNIEENIPDTTVQLRVKPTFNFWYIIIKYIFGGLFIVLFCVLTFGNSFLFNGLIWGLIGMFIMIIYAIIVTILKKKEYNYCSYDFYRTKVIYRDNYLNKSEKEIKYKYIREVVMYQTSMQRILNLGNIMLFTNAETEFASGIRIMDVKNAQDVVNNIKSIIDV